MSPRPALADLRKLYRRRLAIIGERGRGAAATREVFAAGADGGLAPPPVRRRFPLEQIAAAHEAAVGREPFGPMIVAVGSN